MGVRVEYPSKRQEGTSLVCLNATSHSQGRAKRGLVAETTLLYWCSGTHSLFVGLLGQQENKKFKTLIIQ